MSRLILASASPRRRELLRAEGVVFEVEPANVDETLQGSPTPEEAARELALRKVTHAHVTAMADGHDGSSDRWILAADTVVGLPPRGAGEPWRLLAKAADEDEAREMLGSLSESRHEVVTGVAVARLRAGEPNAEIRVVAETTVVAMRAIAADELDAYVASGEWRDKAGAYAIQETADRFVTELVGGGFDNVVGLPVKRTLRLLESMGWSRDSVAEDPSAG